ncbi:MAG TPA: serine hydrolase domain-containing protein [Nitrospira sp.]|nr:serine hydrolase domain-containing protein [Nitrospira sp.]
MPLAVRLRSLQFLLVFALAFGLAGCGGGSTSSTTSTQPATLGETVDAVAKTAMLQQHIPGMTVALGKSGQLLYVGAYGVSDTGTSQATQPGTIFEIGSITKQFTAALIMQLQERGKLNVDDSIDLYLSEYAFPPVITLRMLLTHTSGLPNYTTFPQINGWSLGGVSESTVLTAISQTPLDFPPGTQWSYSNSNYFLLGAIIEKVTGQTYEANLQQHIFQPLGLTNTYYSLPPVAQSATGYMSDGSVATLANRSASFAAGALSSNVFDLIAWDNALIHGKVVSPASFTAMTTSSGFTMPGGGTYGFGLAMRTFNNRPVIWHNGAIWGFTAETEVFLDSGFSVVVLTNSFGANPDIVVNQVINSVCNSEQLSSNC